MHRKRQAGVWFGGNEGMGSMGGQEHESQTKLCQGRQTKGVPSSQWLVILGKGR